MFELNNFDAIQIKMASPKKIREWSYGEVTKPETINYRTQKPETDGLFCEKIFGPTKDWECKCGKYKRIRYKGVICDKCGVEVTRSKVRRERMGHIELAAPVSHIWYFRGVPSRIGLLLDMTSKELEQVIYFVSYVVLDPKETGLQKQQVLSDKEYTEACEKYGADAFRVGMGAEAIKELLMQVDIEAESEKLHEQVLSNVMQKRLRAIKRLEIVEAFKKCKQEDPEFSPSWMILDVVPVIPPEIRPMVQLDGGRFATSDLNDLYRRVINRNNRLKRLMELGAPDIMIRNEKRMLQEAVDALIDNGRRGKAVAGPGNRDLKSLSAMLRGKQGRFRQNLLGKRVDYSGRSVIVVGPELKLYQCGLPKEMALELFKPFVMKRLVEDGYAHNIKSAKHIVERARPEVWDILEDVIKDHPVLLNRAPTLHRLGIQAFEPVLVEGRALKLHPLACTAFNADFDGDQMAVHVPLSIEAQTEARFLMLSTNNILKLSDGRPVVSPTQDMVLGSFYLTKYREGAKGEGRVFMSPDEAIMAYQAKTVDLQAKVRIRMFGEFNGKPIHQLIETSVGRLIFNQSIPQDLGFVDRTKEESCLDLEMNCLVGKSQLSKIVDACFKYKGSTETANVLDKIKATGYKYSTIGALTASVFDMHILPTKKALVEEAEAKVHNIEKKYDRGFLTEEERYTQVVNVWRAVFKQMEEDIKNALPEHNPIRMMADSGARGSTKQILQLIGMRGLMSDPTGKTIELPVKSNFREGLSVLEYFISSHGGRKGLADTALRTADSGYLTRRLVDVSHNVIVRETDCGDTKGTIVACEVDENPVGQANKRSDFESRIKGRFTIGAIVVNGEVIAEADSLIDEDVAKKIASLAPETIKSVNIRSILTCKSKNGVCVKCYGANLASGRPVKLGEAVGIIAAQSIGEPGTQLTMRTFHSGGVATGDDITQGLPRVEELFEARRPKRPAIIAEITGVVSIGENDREVSITSAEGEVKTYVLPFDARKAPDVVDGAKVVAGAPITQGSIYPQDLLRVLGVKGVQEYILKEVHAAYSNSGVNICSKHVEVIVRQMLRKVRIENQGDTNMLPGELVDIFEYEEENKRVMMEAKRPANARRTLLGITKAALATDSFLSAASFQETARVLTEAAIKNKIDPLLGLKENVIIGKLIPAGTGMKLYKNYSPATAPESIN
ncbi:MAG: DNA-directed RNA polymerase subunit beta' [Clostridia bacterium]|nr:DNA-directed RNA polymerase subunit beta' [Clostridia bacterium]